MPGRGILTGLETVKPRRLAAQAKLRRARPRESVKGAFKYEYERIFRMFELFLPINSAGLQPGMCKFNMFVCVFIYLLSWKDIYERYAFGYRILGVYRR